MLHQLTKVTWLARVRSIARCYYACKCTPILQNAKRFYNKAVVLVLPELVGEIKIWRIHSKPANCLRNLFLPRNLNIRYKVEDPGFLCTSWVQLGEIMLGS
jgi:hypothetical protein